MRENRANDVFDMIADIVISREQVWRNDAACKKVDLELFFPKQNHPMLYNRAKKVCEHCPVRAECRADWETMPPAMQRHGVWWGTTDKDRRHVGKL